MRYRVLGAIRIYMEKNKGKSPPMGVLGKACEIKNDATVLHYLKQLEQEGLIKRLPLRGHVRPIVLRGPASFMRLPTMARNRPLKQEKNTTRRKQREQDCFEQAVAMGKARDEADALRRADGESVLHDKYSLFRNGQLRACKVG
jgi:hypothetical protein